MIRVEKSKRSWHCYHCGSKHPKNVFRAHAFICSKERSFCMVCIAKTYIELLCKNNIEPEQHFKDAVQEFKNNVMEVTI